MRSVTHIVHSLEVGGLERVVLDLVHEGQRLRQETSIICLEQPGELAAEAEAMGAAVRCVGKPPGVKFGTIRKLREIFSELRPEVVHTHQIGALFYAGPAARRAGVPVIVHTEHGHHAYQGRTRWLAWWAARYAQRFFCVSADIASAVVDGRIAPLSKVQVVSNGIDVASFAARENAVDVRTPFGIPADAPVVGTVGRLNEIKRQDVLIRGFAQIKIMEPQPHLLLVGDGPMRDELCRLAEDLGVGPRVHFAGFQDDPRPFLNAMDVFALTSRSEGMPLSILEAWAAGLPVVASRVGGLPELIEHGCNGLMFENGDVAGLSVHLTSLLNDPERARGMGQVGRQRVAARFDVSVMANEYHRHYRELLAGRDCPIDPVEAATAIEAP